MLLYLESQLAEAYQVYISKIPQGNGYVGIEEFGGMVENDEEWFDHECVQAKQMYIEAQRIF